MDGPLFDYIRKADQSYHWTTRYEGQWNNNSYTELTLVSQQWRGITWKHRLFVVRPANVAENTAAILVIGGGAWRPEDDQPLENPPPLPKEALLLFTAASQLKAPVAVLTTVPFQPIFDGKMEDAIIAYTFDEYLKTGETNWPLLLPMVKSSVRAMDAIQEFADSHWELKIPRFLVAGASKRGWTTWLTAAVDQRVASLAPMVIDMLNLKPQLKHQVGAWGQVSHEMGDYVQYDLPRRLNTAKGEELRQIIDPHHYRDLINQPKMIFLGTNDAYWPVDALTLYWDDLVGQKYIVYVPNGGHDLGNDVTRLVGGLIALHRHTEGTQPLPKIHWTHAKAGRNVELCVNGDPPPIAATVWTAHSAKRDFREAHWQATTMNQANNSYTHTTIAHDHDFTAFYAEFAYTSGNVPFYLCTTVRVVEPNDGARREVEEP